MIATAAQHKATARMELERFKFANELPKTTVASKLATFQLLSYSITGWTGARVKGLPRG